MGQEEEQPQTKRARFAESPLQQQVARSATPVVVSSLPSSCTTGTTTAPLATSQQQAPSKQPTRNTQSSAGGPTPENLNTQPMPVIASHAAGAQHLSAAASGTTTTSTSKVTSKPTANFLADAREAVQFCAVAGPSEQALLAEIATGGAPVSVDFLHQHFGDAEQIRGYSNLKITIWIHVRTYHCWVDICYEAKRPGADKLSDIFEGAFPSGYCKSREEFVDAAVAAGASMPNLMTLGQCVGEMTVPASAFGLTSPTTPAPPIAAPTVGAAAAAAPGATAKAPGPPAAQASENAAAATFAAVPSKTDRTDADTMNLEQGGNEAGNGTASGAGAGEVSRLAAKQPPQVAAPAAAGLLSPGSAVTVSVRRFQIKTAPPEVKALHQRMEPLLLFTIDGANFIDDEDPQWELLLPAAQTADGGCVVMGLTTLFNFYAHPSSCRLRISQVLVLSPWQGLGLGKALLDLSYKIARSRNCTDLTVEDPTPNLQRVREKLEVEMMRRLGKVTAQAERCIEAVVRGETSWPSWSPPEEDECLGAPGYLQPVGAERQGRAAAVGELGTAAAAVASGETYGDGGGGGDGQRHPLLASHGFFAALDAAPPAGREVPSTLQAEAEARSQDKKQALATGAEQKGRGKQVPQPEATAAVAGSPQDGGGGGDDAGGGAAVVAAPAGTASEEEETGGSASPRPSDALIPSAAFVSAVSRQLKMHPGQVRVVWEALLWCMPGALQRRGVRVAVEQLISRRLESLHFSSVGRAAAAKRLVDVRRVTATDVASADKDDAIGLDFVMYRPVGRAGQPPGAQNAAADAAAGDAGAVATGRLNLTQVTVEDKARRMLEMTTERMQQLESLAAALSRGHHAVAAGPTNDIVAAARA